MSKIPDRLASVRENSKHDPVKFGLSRYCDEYRRLPYGERVRLESSLSINDVKILDLIQKSGKISLKELEQQVHKDFDIKKLLDAQLISKDSNRYGVTRKGMEVWEAIVVYHGG